MLEVSERILLTRRLLRDQIWSCTRGSDVTVGHSIPLPNHSLQELPYSAVRNIGYRRMLEE